MMSGANAQRSVGASVNVGIRRVSTHSGPRRLSAVGNLIFAEVALSALPRAALYSADIME
jgi:hypothetical protein